VRLSTSKQLIIIKLYYDFGAVTHDDRRFQFRLFNHLVRIVPDFMGKFRINRR